MRTAGVLALVALSCAACGSSGDGGAPNDASTDATIDATGDSVANDAPIDASGEDRPAPACDATFCIYASPTGGGSSCSFDAPCTLQGAQTAARSHAGGGVHVLLFGGTYALASAFVL